MMTQYVTRRTTSLRRRVAVVGGVALASLVLPATSLPVLADGGPAASAASGSGRDHERAAAADKLTNLAHLDWLSTTVAPPRQRGHTTYRLRRDPELGVLWTYAEPNPDGSFRHVGGGTYDADSDTWSQGAYNADDVTRAAVVYLRHWQATGNTDSRDAAYQLLRGVTYLQTVTGKNAGNVVLWMQPDGTLNRSAEPVELPDPSDSDASYWLARTIWALGEGYAAFDETRPRFARFLRDRLELAIDAVDRQVLDAYGQYLNIDGQRTPAWLIADGADATSEAMLGLSAYLEAGGSRNARRTLSRLAEGVATMSEGSARRWPFGAVLPWARSRSIWHAWGSQMPGGLARASVALGDRGLARAAVKDSFTFDPWLLTSGGPDNGRLPARGDASQIAYGADSRVQSLLATDDATGRHAARSLAGVFAAWFFGANPAGEAMYDPATGRTFDGISAEGTINRNSGAESTIHGLLSMLALDENPDVARLARTATIQTRRGTLTVEAEDGALTGNASVVEPETLWTGESLFGGSGYVALADAGSVSFELPAHARSLVLPVVEFEHGSGAVTAVRAGDQVLGRVRSGAIGTQGDSPAPHALLPVTLRRTLPARATELTATGFTRGSTEPARLDAVMLQPLVSRLVLRGDGHGTGLLSSASDRTEHRSIRVAGAGPARIRTYNGRGQLVATRHRAGDVVEVAVPAGGFAIIRR